MYVLRYYIGYDLHWLVTDHYFFSPSKGVQIFILFTLQSFLKTRSRYKLDSKTESKGEPA